MTRRVFFPAALVLLLIAAPSPSDRASACCDWTPQDSAFWDKMYENPQKFSYDMGARPAHYRIRTGAEEEFLNPASAQSEELWGHVLHHMSSGKHHTGKMNRRH